MRSFLFLRPDGQPAAAQTPTFDDKVLTALGRPLAADSIAVLQVNLGYRCNLACSHCHVSAGPDRREAMAAGTMDEVLDVLGSAPIQTLDITGGAPELHPRFRTLVHEARAMGKRVLVRTNLTVLLLPGNEDLPAFFRENKVELIASLPCYLEQNVNQVRGGGAYAGSIEALRRLNSMGYGMAGDGGLLLSLVYNPAGPFLPPRQSQLEADYKRELLSRFGISFTRLYAFTNMPIGRFRTTLARTGELDRYGSLLVSSFNPAALAGVMCRTMVSVGWDGVLYDCDFNQVLAQPVSEEAHRHIRSYDHDLLSNRKIRTGNHCFACTAGQGSS